MTDTIKSIPAMQPDGDNNISDAVLLNLAKVVDNHGNDFKNFNLSCSHGTTHHLDYDQNLRLLDSIAETEHSAFWHAALHLQTAGEVMDVRSGESPLQTLCRTLEAERHHSPQSKLRVQSK